MRLSGKAIVIALLVLVTTMLIECNNLVNNSTASTNTEVFTYNDVDKGQAFAAIYCQSCHQLPAPSLLSKAVWQKHVLPVMSSYLGINSAFSTGRQISPESDDNYLAVKPAVDAVKWRQIVAYYVSKAPARLPAPYKAEPIHSLPFFDIKPATQEYVYPHALASYVKIDTTVIPRRLIVCDGLANQLIVLNDKMQILKSTPLGGPIVDLLLQKNKITATIIGADLWANNFKNGLVQDIGIDKMGIVTTPNKPVFQQLSRPVSVNILDLNQDGKKDYLIAQFGKMTGKLSWFEKKGDNGKEHVLRDKPGCIKTIVDYNNKNKLPDIWALFAQGDEGIFLYTNKGKDNFEEKRVLSFPPSYGSSSFDLVDFNGDGFKDIIYTCGDNADFSQVLKPYHGLYIYLNDGKNNFTKRFFYPIHGCYKAIAKDFDGDGDLDIATISAFPGGKEPWEAFIYLENKGRFKFQSYTLPLNIPFTRATTMDAGDIDGDGKIDLLLGNGFAADGIGGPDKEPLFMVLKNISKSTKGK